MKPTFQEGDLVAILDGVEEVAAGCCPQALFFSCFLQVFSRQLGQGLVSALPYHLRLMEMILVHS